MNVKSDNFSTRCTALWSGEGTSTSAAAAEKRRHQAAVVTTQCVYDGPKILSSASGMSHIEVSGPKTDEFAWRLPVGTTRELYE